MSSTFQNTQRVPPCTRGSGIPAADGSTRQSPHQRCGCQLPRLIETLLTPANFFKLVESTG